MITFEVLPHVGLGPVRLSSSRNGVREALQRLGYRVTYSQDSLDYFCQNSLQVEYGVDGSVDFIGIAGTEDLRVCYFGLDVFDTPADQVFIAIARRETSGNHTYDPTEYQFPQQIVTLWEADEQYDHRGGGRWPVWGQIGVGTARYLGAVAAVGGGR